MNEQGERGESRKEENHEEENGTGEKQENWEEEDEDTNDWVIIPPDIFSTSISGEASSGSALGSESTSAPKPVETPDSPDSAYTTERRFGVKLVHEDVEDTERARETAAETEEGTEIRAERETGIETKNQRPEPETRTETQTASETGIENEGTENRISTLGYLFNFL